MYRYSELIVIYFLYYFMVMCDFNDAYLLHYIDDSSKRKYFY